MENVQKALNTAAYLADKAASSPQVMEFIIKLSAMAAQAFKAGKKILICGNGGSAADAMHFAEEFTGRFRKDRPALPVMALTDPSHITCVGNDYGFEEIFSRGVEAWGNEGDIFIGLSTSGNSANVINAFQKAEFKSMHTVLFLGKNGGKLKGKAELEMISQGKTTDRIQELHMMVMHIIIEQVERLLFPENYR